MATSTATAHRSRELVLWGQPIPWPVLRRILLRLGAVLLVIAALAVVAGELVVHWSGAASIRRWDVSVESDLAAHRSTWANHLSTGGTWFAETIPVLNLTIFGVDLVARATRRWRAAAFVALAVAGEKLVYLVASMVIGRDRPPVPTVGQTYATSSFPSGHVGSAIALYGAVALLVWWGLPARRVLRAVSVLAAVLVALTVAFCRMYRGFHYPTDVIVGAVIGMAWLATCARILGLARSWQPDAVNGRDPARRASPGPPGPHSRDGGRSSPR